MPRIRSLKPEHRQHRCIGPLTDRQYRLWISMILEADDEGRLVADADQLRIQTFPYHPRVTKGHVEEALQVLSACGRVHLYEIEGRRYAVFPKWPDHQHPKYPTRSKLPPPPILLQSSSNCPGGVPRQFPPRVVELSREELRGVERRGESVREENPPARSVVDTGQTNRTGLDSFHAPAEIKRFIAQALPKLGEQLKRETP